MRDRRTTMFLPFFWLLLSAPGVAAFSAAPKKDGASVSGGKQYIHDESCDRQYLLHQCFRQSSVDAFHMAGIIENSKEQNTENSPSRVLEIGCGAGHTTIDLLGSVLPQDATIVAVDADSSMIDAANARLEQMDSSFSNRIHFRHQTGETLAAEMSGQFDAVWIRFVVVHIPDPDALLRAAISCLKPGGILLVEDTYTTGTSSLCDPPRYAHEFFHKMHAEATLKLGGDLTRGSKIGRYLRNLGLKSINGNTFAPIFGRGISVPPWTAAANATSVDISSAEKFEFGWQLLRSSSSSLMTKLEEMGLCTEEELQKARESLSEFQDDMDNNSDAQQIFSLPDGTIFQWWGRKL